MKYEIFENTFQNDNICVLVISKFRKNNNLCMATHLIVWARNLIVSIFKRRILIWRKYYLHLQINLNLTSKKFHIVQNDSLEVLQLSSDPYLVPVLPNGPAAPVHHSLSRPTTTSRVIVDILFPSNRNIHKSSCSL